MPNNRMERRVNYKCQAQARVPAALMRSVRQHCGQTYARILRGRGALSGGEA